MFRGVPKLKEIYYLQLDHKNQVSSYYQLQKF